MTTDVYHKLAKHLDSLPPGYPATDTGVELRILRRLFTPQQAELALHLSLLGEEARVVARRAGLPVDVTRQRLEEMAGQGLIYCLRRPGKPVLYQIIYFVIGIWEFQVGHLTKELVQDVDEYFTYMFDHGIWRTSAQLRTIPVMESINARQEVMLYEQAEEIIRSRKTLLVAPCICRQERALMGAGCGKPSETCLIFDSAAHYYHDNGLGRMIGKQEALDVLALADQAGLVLQPTNSQDPGAICTCCGDCCGVLRNLNRMPNPSSVAVSGYQAHHDPALCAACGMCAQRCQMNAVTENAGVYSLDVERCIGCGLCVTTCPTGAMTLVRKPEAELPHIPRTTVHNALDMWHARDKLYIPGVVMMGIRSKVDRLLALRHN